MSNKGEYAKEYSLIALKIAEERGVIEYNVKANTMTYDANYPAEHNTIRVVINLNTMKETRTIRQKYL